MTTLGTLVTQVGDRVDDSAHRRFPQTQVRTWINEGCREICRRAECNYKSTTISVSASTQDLTLSTIDVVRLHHVTFTPVADPTSTYPLDYYDLRDMDSIWGVWRGQESSYPEFYTTWGMPPALGVTLAPVPSAAGTLTVYYYSLPTALSTTGSDDAIDVDLPQGWEDLAVDYAVGLCARKDRKSDEYTIAMQVFTDRLQALVDTATRYNDTPGQITPDLHWSASGGGFMGGGGYGGWW